MSKQNTAKYLDFLNNHPAIVNDLRDTFLSASAFWISNCSKEGETEKDPISIININDEYYSHVKNKTQADIDDYERFKSKFKKGDSRIYVNYEEYYGKKWKFDHVKYSVDVTFTVFMGDFKKKDYDKFSMRSWQSYQGFWVSGKSFDEMIKKAYDKTLERYGNFNIWSDDMMTDAEIKNNKKEKVFFLKPYKGKGGGKELITNDKHYHLNNPVFNRRWLKWFFTTEECRKWDTNDGKSPFGYMVEKTPDWVFDFVASFGR
jgi:hypothetical protein